MTDQEFADGLFRIVDTLESVDTEGKTPKQIEDIGVVVALAKSIIQLLRFDELEFNAASPSTPEEYEEAIDAIRSAQDLNRSLRDKLRALIADQKLY
jgi:hypothetical protein